MGAFKNNTFFLLVLVEAPFHYEKTRELAGGAGGKREASGK